MFRRSQRWMLIINNRFLSLYDYNFLLVIEKIFSVTWYFQRPPDIYLSEIEKWKRIRTQRRLNKNRPTAGSPLTTVWHLQRRIIHWQNIHEPKDYIRALKNIHSLIGLPRDWKKKSVCKVRTQDPENFDEEVKSLVTAWRLMNDKPLTSSKMNSMIPMIGNFMDF